MFNRREKMPPNTTNTHCLSDHHPFMINYSNNAVCFVWNILVQMKGGNFFNNGFGCNLETEEQYVSRLNHLASQINSVIDEKAPAFICLQETPKTEQNREEFISLINKKYASENLTSESTQITFYDRELYTQLPDLTQKIKSITLTGGLLNRVIPLVLLDNVSKERILLINVHANFNKEIENDVISLHEGAKNNGINHIIFTGDFNRNLAGIQEADASAKHDIYKASQNGCFHDLHVFSTPDASFMAKKDKETNQVINVLETRDGCLTSMNVAVENLIQINRPSAKVTTLISEDLKNIPEGFNQEKNASYGKCLG